jgi:hypothetical protein
MVQSQHVISFLFIDACRDVGFQQGCADVMKAQGQPLHASALNFVAKAHGEYPSQCFFNALLYGRESFGNANGGSFSQR